MRLESQGGAINIGSYSSTAKTINIGNVIGATALNLNSGTGAINIGTSIAKTIYIGNSTVGTGLVLNAGSTGGITLNSNDSPITLNAGTAGSPIYINSTGGSGSIQMNGGNGTSVLRTTGGTIGIGDNASAQTINIGNTTGATALTLDSGTGAISIGTSIAKTITIGNQTGAASLNLRSGTGKIKLSVSSQSGINIDGSVPNSQGGYFICMDGVWNLSYTFASSCIPSLGKYKKNIVTLGDSINDVMKLRPVVFNWNPETYQTINAGDYAQRQVGFIAEEVQAVNPLYSSYTYLSATSTEGILSGVEYSKITALAIKAIQEQNDLVFGTSTNALVMASSTFPDGLAPALVSLASSTAPLANNAGEKTFAGRFFDRLTAWFGDATNGIGDFFANRVRTKEICVGDAANGGETCVTKAQLDTLLAGQNQSANQTQSPTPEPVPVITDPVAPPVKEPTVQPVEPAVEPVSKPEPTVDSTIKPIPVEQPVVIEETVAAPEPVVKPAPTE
ncbi:MAG: tail fiber domain-containing protein [Candidatus Magasanikbacteria bacterium]|nr:tail fiber domain-containing protein [Candidatus Magasanikbacteria bacterium]